MLSGVTRKMAGQFFAALDADIAGGPAALAAAEVVGLPEAAGVAGAPGVPGAAPTTGPRTYAGRAAAPAGASALEGSRGFALGVVAGGVIALLGVALGARLGRRR